MYKNIVLGNN